jgi:PPOX class probable F420-dependent enzyme
VDAAEMRSRVAAARVGRLATVRPDGRPHVVPCCFALRGDTIWSAVDTKAKSTLALQRLTNLAVHPDVALLVDHYDDDWTALWWVRIDGRAVVLDDDAAERAVALALLRQKYAQYRAAAPPGAVIAIAIRSWRGWP